MAYKPWEVQEDLWKEKCKWGDNQDKAFLVHHMAQRTGKSIVETLRDLELAEYIRRDGAFDISKVTPIFQINKNRKTFGYTKYFPYLCSPF